jgi:hypothetical protein
VHLVQIGITARGKSAQQVERAGGLEIAEFHARRVGGAGVRSEVGAVDDVAAVAGQRHLALGFGVRRARLGELAGHPAHLHHRQRRPEGQNHRHLQQHAEGVANVVGSEIDEALSAITALQQEGLTGGDLGQRSPELARLTREHQWRIAAQPRLGGRQCLGIGIDRHLHGGPTAPARRGPVAGARTTRLRFRGRRRRALNRGHFLPPAPGGPKVRWAPFGVGEPIRAVDKRPDGPIRPPVSQPAPAARSAWSRIPRQTSGGSRPWRRTAPL